MRALVLLLLTAGASLAGLPVKVAVVNFGPSDSSEQIARAIAKLDGIEVLHERLESRAAGKETLTNDERRAFGVVFQSELLLLVSGKGDSFAYVDGGTGEELFRIREDSTESLVRSAFLLVEELRDAEKAAAEKPPE
jgi:hypothetical protein